MLALQPDELQAKMDRIEAEGRGLTVLQRMLRDAHGWDDENDRPNHPDQPAPAIRRAATPACT
jgi:hypothetical protein